MEMVECKKYHARLSMWACAARYDRAVRDLKAGEYCGDPGCRVCEVGKERAITVGASGGRPVGATARLRRVPTISKKQEDAPMTDTIKLRCSRCKEMLGLDAFNGNKANRHRHGKQTECRDCQKATYGGQAAKKKAAPSNDECGMINDEKKGVRRGHAGIQIDAGQPPAAKIMDRADFFEPNELVATFQNHLIIDFTDHPDLEEFVNADARREFRTPEAHVLYMIRSMKKFKEPAHA